MRRVIFLERVLEKGDYSCARMGRMLFDLEGYNGRMEALEHGQEARARTYQLGRERRIGFP